MEDHPREAPEAEGAAREAAEAREDQASSREDQGRVRQGGLGGPEEELERP